MIQIAYQITLRQPVYARALGGGAGIDLVRNEARLVAQYNYSIHILAMLVVGFGFLMVFVKRYGFGATTGTYLVVAAGLPLYIFLRANGIVGHAVKAQTVEALMLAEFSVATALIAMGAVLGRLRVFQYAVLTLVLVPLYALNEYLVLDNGSGLTKGFQDSAGSIVIHAFGAYFGLAASLVLTTEQQRSRPIACHQSTPGRSGNDGTKPRSSSTPSVA